MVEETTGIAANSASRFSWLEGGGDGGVLVSTQKSRHDVVKADIFLGDQLATKRIVRAHSTQRGKKDKLVHALLEGETRGGGEGDVARGRPGGHLR